MPNVFKVRHVIWFWAALGLQQVTVGPRLLLKSTAYQSLLHTCFSDKCRVGLFGLFVFLLYVFQFGIRQSTKQTGCPWQPDPLSWESSCFSCIFIRDVERFLYRLACTALCSFSSAAHLVGYYAKEMESIAERWVMLFTGKSDDQRQGITPSRSDVSWKIPLFHREEGKVHKIGNGRHDHRNFGEENEENLLNIWAKIFSQPGTL